MEQYTNSIKAFIEETSLDSKDVARIMQSASYLRQNDAAPSQRPQPRHGL